MYPPKLAETTDKGVPLRVTAISPVPFVTPAYAERVPLVVKKVRF